ncbi:MAG: ATP-dependent DNA helicase RecG, partial [Cyanobacteriota bacterium]
MAPSPSVQNAPDWERLRKALSVEAERGFSDLVGREFRFHEFLEYQLKDPPARLAASDRQRWQDLAAEFANYPSLTLAQRQHLVAESRRVLLQSERSLEMRSRSQRPPVTPRKPPTAELHSQVSPAQLTLDQPLTQVRQIGRRGGDRLARLGLYRVQDLLEYFPRDRIDYARQVPIAQLEPGETVTVVAQVQSCSFFSSSKNKKLSIFQLTLKDPTGRLKISRFYPGNRYSSTRWQYAHKSQYPRGATVAASGLVKKNKYGITLENPDLEVLENSESRIESLSVGRVLPVYALTDGVTADLVRKSVLAVLPASEQIPEPLPRKLREKYELLDRPTAIANIHFPPDTDILDLARRRLVFDEFFYLQLGLLKRRHELKQAGELQLAHSQAQRLTIQGQLIEQFYNLLPFNLTHAQTRVIQEILGDLNKTSPMNRLVQGDVGAGKTVVAVV